MSPTPVLAEVTGINVLAVILVIIGLAVAYMVILMFVKAGNAAEEQKKKKEEQVENEIRSFWLSAKKANRLSAVATNFILKPGEVCYLDAPTTMYEPRAQRTYQAGHAGVRVAKGIVIGGTRGRSVSHDEITPVGTGRICVTNQRVIFDGDKNDRNIPLDKLISVNLLSDSVEISCENRQKSMYFTFQNPGIAMGIIRICAAGKATDLSTVEAEF